MGGEGEGGDGMVREVMVWEMKERKDVREVHVHVGEG